jgi:hypothetical protein
MGFKERIKGFFGRNNIQVDVRPLPTGISLTAEESTISYYSSEKTPIEVVEDQLAEMYPTDLEKRARILEGVIAKRAARETREKEA